MPLAQISFTKEENDIILKYSKLWNLSKHETIKLMVRDFKELEGGKKQDVQKTEER